nr:MAG TPA: hypothetical protein [Caudoviricetes sp.]
MECVSGSLWKYRVKTKSYIEHSRLFIRRLPKTH